jgi:hypothetical protein
MNPFILPAQDRLEDWKAFRKSLVGLPEEEQFAKTAKYWAMAPLSKIAYDVEQPSTWLTPWEMVSAGDWCRNSVAIGMEFTLRLAGMKADRLRLEMFRDYDISEAVLVLIIDERRVLNYTYGEVIDYPNTRHDVVGRWQFSGKFYATIDS